MENEYLYITILEAKIAALEAKLTAPKTDHGTVDWSKEVERKKEQGLIPEDK